MGPERTRAYLLPLLGKLTEPEHHGMKGGGPSTMKVHSGGLSGPHSHHQARSFVS